MRKRMPGTTVVRPIGCSSELPRMRENAVEARSGDRPGRCRLRRFRLRWLRVGWFRDGEGADGAVGGLVGDGAWAVALGLRDGLDVGLGDGDGPLLVGLDEGDGPLPVGLGLGDGPRDGDAPLPVGLGYGDGDAPLPVGLG